MNNWNKLNKSLRPLKRSASLREAFQYAGVLRQLYPASALANNTARSKAANEVLEATDNFLDQGLHDMAISLAAAFNVIIAERNDHRHAAHAALRAADYALTASRSSASDFMECALHHSLKTDRRLANQVIDRIRDLVEDGEFQRSDFRYLRF
jgi:hypothetical protein